MQRCDLPFSRYSRLNIQNLRQKFGIFAILWGCRPQRGEENAGTYMYHRAKFQIDRCHCRRDICNGTKKLTSNLIIRQNAYTTSWTV